MDKQWYYILITASIIVITLCCLIRKFKSNKATPAGLEENIENEISQIPPPMRISVRWSDKEWMSRLKDTREEALNGDIEIRENQLKHAETINEIKELKLWAQELDFDN